MGITKPRRLLTSAGLAGMILAPGVAPLAAQSDRVGEWRAFGGGPENTKFSPLSQITPDNFMDLEIGWRWTTISADVLRERAIRAGQFRAGPGDAPTAAFRWFDEHGTLTYETTRVDNED